MRNLKKVMAFVLALALTMSTFTVAFAASTSASTLGDLGLLSDTSDSSLGAGLTREIGLVMILKMLGYTQADADAAPAATFTDTEGWLTAWANLAYEKGITEGTSATTFSPEATLTQKDFISLVLRGIGYVGTYDDYVEVSATAGLPVDDLTAFTKADAAKVMLAALTATQKDTTDLLINKLIADGVVTSEAAITAGLVSDELAILSATATGAKQLTVKFNRPVDTSAVTFSATRDDIKVTFASTTWNEAKTEATLAVSYKLFAGDYVVTVKNGDDSLVSDTFEVKDEEIASITFPSDNVVLTSDTDGIDDNTVATSVVIKNQYGEDITDNYDETDVNVVPSKSTSVDLTKGTVTLTYSSAYTTDEKVTITIIDSDSGVSGTKVFTVAAAANIASITIGDVTTDEDSTTIHVSDIENTSDKYWLPLTVIDQYGNTLKEAELEEDLTIISSNNTYLEDTSTETNANLIGTENDVTVLYLVAGASIAKKDVTFTVVSKSGKTASKTVSIIKDNQVDTFKFSKPSEVVKQDVEVDLPFVAADQYGTQLVKAEDGLALSSGDRTMGTTLELGTSNDTKITVTNATIKASVDYANDDALVITIKPTDTDKDVVLVVNTPTNNVETLTLSVNDKPEITGITGLDEDFYKAIQAGQTENLDIDDFTFVDQYGDSIDYSSSYPYTLVADNGSSHVSMVDNGDDTFDFTAVAPTTTTAYTGADKYTLTIKDSSSNTIDTYSFTMSNVALKDITEFGVSDMDKLYVGTSYLNNTTTDSYDTDVEIYGKKGSTDVYVDQDLIKSISTTSDLVFDAVKHEFDQLETVGNNIDTEGADKTATITVLVEGSSLVTCTKTVTYSSAAPVAQSINLVKTGKKAAQTDTTIEDTLYDTVELGNKVTGSTIYDFYAKDQYGIGTWVADSYLVSNISRSGVTAQIDISNTGANVAPNNIKTMNVTAGTLQKGDNFTLTAIIDGLYKSVYVVLN